MTTYRMESSRRSVSESESAILKMQTASRTKRAEEREARERAISDQYISRYMVRYLKILVGFG